MILIQFKHDDEVTWGQSVSTGFPDLTTLPENIDFLIESCYEKCMKWADAMDYNRNSVAFQILRGDGGVIYTHKSFHTTVHENVHY